MTNQILTVFGATGNQGGSVIDAVLSHPRLSKQFTVRGVTRDVSKPASQKLAARGVQVVAADMNDKESLRSAIAGSHSVFAVTNFWEKCSKEIEIQQGKNIADVCKSYDVKHLIWSTLPHVSKLTNGKLPNVHHFDGKAEIDEYIRELGIPMTSFVPGFFMSNFKVMMTKDNNNYSLALPVPRETRFPLFDAAHDTGKFVAAILLKPSSFLNAKVLGASGFYTGEDIVKTFSSITKKNVSYNEAPSEIWKSHSNYPPAIAQEMLENFYLIKDYKYFGSDSAEKDLEACLKSLEQPPTSLEDFVKQEQAPLL